MDQKPYPGVDVGVVVREWLVGLKWEVDIESVSRGICMYGGGREIWVHLKMFVDYRGVP